MLIRSRGVDCGRESDYDALSTVQSRVRSSIRQKVRVANDAGNGGEKGRPTNEVRKEKAKKASEKGPAWSGQRSHHERGIAVKKRKVV